MGTSFDDLAMKSFFAILKNNVLNRQRWSTRVQLPRATVIWTARKPIGRSLAGRHQTESLRLARQSLAVHVVLRSTARRQR
jgi:hypothetical protein